jgi:hypothetical protein
VHDTPPERGPVQEDIQIIRRSLSLGVPAKPGQAGPLHRSICDEAAWGGAGEVRPKFISRSDPAAQWTGALKGYAFFAYATNYLIDLDFPRRSGRRLPFLLA